MELDDGIQVKVFAHIGLSFFDPGRHFLFNWLIKPGVLVVRSFEKRDEPCLTTFDARV